jgi:hypothetical protein
MEIVSPEEAASQGAAQSQTATPPVTPDPATPPVPAAAPKQWKFVKLFGVADVIRMPDGSKFQFRAILRNDGDGYLTNSFVITEDEKFANGLRKVAGRIPALGIKEVSV